MKIAIAIWMLWSLVATFYAVHEIDDRLAAHYECGYIGGINKSLPDHLKDLETEKRCGG